MAALSDVGKQSELDEMKPLKQHLLEKKLMDPDDMAGYANVYKLGGEYPGFSIEIPLGTPMGDDIASKIKKSLIDEGVKDHEVIVTSDSSVLTSRGLYQPGSKIASRAVALVISRDGLEQLGRIQQQKKQATIGKIDLKDYPALFALSEANRKGEVNFHDGDFTLPASLKDGTSRKDIMESLAKLGKDKGELIRQLGLHEDVHIAGLDGQEGVTDMERGAVLFGAHTDTTPPHWTNREADFAVQTQIAPRVQDRLRPDDAQNAIMVGRQLLADNRDVRVNGKPVIPEEVRIDASREDKQFIANIKQAGTRDRSGGGRGAE